MRLTRKEPTTRARLEADASLNSPTLAEDVRQLILATRGKIARTVNMVLLLHYRQVGERIRKDILKEKRAEYGGEILPTLSATLVPDFGRGCGARNLARMTTFVEVLLEPKVVAALSQQLGRSK